MPTSPTGLCRDCSSRAIASGYCAKHQDSQNAKDRLYDRFRADDPIRSLYRCARWKATRRKVLNRDILCTSCGHKAATDVDHILSARLVVDNFGKEEFYNPDRCQGLCHACHSSKTANECGWTGRKGTRLTELSNRQNTTIICGAAGSGKTTYVAEHKQPDDHVWDYDVVMAEITGLPLYEALPGAVGSVLAHRDSFIEATARSTNHVWIIVCNPKAVIVKVLADAGAKVITLDTPDDVCRERIAARLKSA